MEEFSSMIQQIFTYQPHLEAEAGGSLVQGLKTAMPSPRLRVCFPDTASVNISPVLSPLSLEPNEIKDTHSFLNSKDHQFHMCQPNPREIHHMRIHTLKCRSSLK